MQEQPQLQEEQRPGGGIRDRGPGTRDQGLGTGELDYRLPTNDHRLIFYFCTG